MEQTYTKKMQAVFLEEAGELLINLEGALLALEESPEEKEIIDQVLRGLHTLKGSGVMSGFDNISEFTHEIESAFDLLRNGTVTVFKELIDLTLSACDQITSMLNGEKSKELSFRNNNIIQEIKNQILNRMGKDQSALPDIFKEEISDEAITKEEIFETYRIRFKPSL